MSIPFLHWAQSWVGREEVFAVGCMTSRWVGVGLPVTPASCNLQYLHINFSKIQFFSILTIVIFTDQIATNKIFILTFHTFYVWNFNFPYFHIYFNFPKLKHILSKRRRNWLAFRNSQEDLPLEIYFWDTLAWCHKVRSYGLELICLDWIALKF